MNSLKRFLCLCAGICCIVATVIVCVSGRTGSQPRLIASIKIPGDDYLVRADIPVYGDAAGEDFRSYRLEYGSGPDPQEWTLVNESAYPTMYDHEAEVFDEQDDSVLFGNLGTWKTGLKEFQYGRHAHDLRGTYTIRLVVEGVSGETAEDRVTVEVGSVVLNAFGATVMSPDRHFSIAIDEHSLRDAVRVFSIQKDTDALQCQYGYRALSPVYTVRPAGEVFVSPVTVSFDLRERGVRPSADDDAKIGIYFYDEELRTFVYLPTTFTDGIARAALQSLPARRAAFALLAKNEKPAVPRRVHYERFMDQQRQVCVRGLTEPGYSVEVCVDGLKTKVARAVSDGTFEVRGIYLLERVNTITVRVRDEYGEYSDWSEPLVIRHESRPVPITAIGLFDAYYARKAEPLCVHEDLLYIEARGIDPDPETINTALIKVSSQSDPQGILLELYETDTGSGVFRAIAAIGNQSDQDDRVIQAVKDLEQITFESLSGSAASQITYSDMIPPRPPQLIDRGGSHLFAYDFEDTARVGVLSRPPYGASCEIIPDVTDPENRVLQLTNPENWGSFSASLEHQRFDTRTFPFLSFRYRIPPQVSISLYVRNAEGWFEINLHDETKEYNRIGITPLHADPLLVADEAWHAVRINLYELVRDRSKDTSISEIIFADWDEVAYGKLRYGTNLKGDAYWLDDLRLWRPVSKKTYAFDVRVDDDVVELDMTVMKDDSVISREQSAPRPQLFFNATEDGNYSLRVKARDTAGNWSSAARYSFLVDTACPALSDPQAVLFSDAVGEDGLFIGLTDADGSGIDPFSTVVSVDGVEYGYYDDAFRFVEDGLVLKLSHIPGPNSTIRVEQLSDHAKNALSQPIEVSLPERDPERSLRASAPDVFTHLYRFDGTWNATCAWSDTEGMYEGYSFTFDRIPDTEPDDSREGRQNTVDVGDLQSGAEYYFHIKARSKWGFFTESAHVPITIPADNDLSSEKAVWISFDGTHKRLTKYEYEISNDADGEAHDVEPRIDQKKAALDISYAVQPRETASVFYEKDRFDAPVSGALRVEYESAGDDMLDVRLVLVTYEGETLAVSLSDYTSDQQSRFKTALIPLRAFGTRCNTAYLRGIKVRIRNCSEEEITGHVFVKKIGFVPDDVPLIVDDFERALWTEYRNARIWLNSLGGKLFRFSDGFTDIATEHEREEDNGFYRITYSGVRLNGPEGATYCGWQSRLGTLDLTGYNALSFRIRGSRGNENPHVYLCNTDSACHVPIQTYCTVTTEWQGVSIPLIEFARAGIDLSRVEELRFIFEWARMDGAIDIDDIRFESVAFPAQVNAESVVIQQGILTLEGDAGASARLRLSLHTSGFSETRDFSVYPKDGHFRFEVPCAQIGNLLFSLQSENASGIRSPRVIYVKNTQALPSDGPVILEDFDGISRARTWWDVDGTRVYARELKREGSDHYMRVYAAKTRALPWSFFALAFRRDGISNNIEGFKDLTLRLRSIDPRQLLIKLEDTAGNEVRLDCSGGGAVEADTWYNATYTIPPRSRFDCTSVKNILFFAYPGHISKEGSFEIDDLRLQKDPLFRNAIQNV